MINRCVPTSVTRIAALDQRQWQTAPKPRGQWQRGDYVVGEVIEQPGLRTVELPNGRMAEVADGDWLIGALGCRAATLEAVGDWQAVGEDGRFELLTSGGLLGRLISRSPFLPAPMALAYRGHLKADDRWLKMDDFAIEPVAGSFDLPTVMIIGTSMSAGKTTAGKTIIRQLKRAGLRVIGAKLTGAARYRDILGFGDAGADWIFDFIDMGLPSTICPEDLFRQRLGHLLARMGQLEADVLVAEAGASPLESYNGSLAMASLASNIRFTVLCASDPYAVVGVASAFGCQPDLVAGGAANTTAGIELVRKLAGSEALNLLDRQALPRLNTLLAASLGMTL